MANRGRLRITREYIEQAAPEVYDFFRDQKTKTPAALDDVIHHKWRKLAGEGLEKAVDYPTWVAYLCIPWPVPVCMLWNHKKGGGCRSKKCNHSNHYCLYCRLVPASNERVMPAQKPDDGHGLYLQQSPGQCQRKIAFETQLQQMRDQHGCTLQALYGAIQQSLDLPIWWGVVANLYGPEGALLDSTARAKQNVFPILDFMKPAKQRKGKTPGRGGGQHALKASADAEHLALLPELANQTDQAEVAEEAVGDGTQEVVEAAPEQPADAGEENNIEQDAEWNQAQNTKNKREGIEVGVDEEKEAEGNQAEEPEVEESDGVEEGADETRVPDVVDTRPSYTIRKSHILGDVVLHLSLKTKEDRLGKSRAPVFGVFRGLRRVGTHREQVAVKVWKTSDFESEMEDMEKISNNIKAEVLALQRLNSPNVVKFLDYAEKIPEPTGGTFWYFLVMEYAGVHLAAFVQDNNINHEDRKLITQQLFDAYMYIHAERVIHRDVKPDNILVHQPHHGLLRIQLCDFGLAKICPLNTASSSINAHTMDYGTQGWMAPEVMHKDPTLDRASYNQMSDVWSLGCLVFWLYNDANQLFQNNDGLHVVMLDKDALEPLLAGKDQNFKLQHPLAYELVTRTVVFNRLSRSDLKTLRTSPFFWDYSFAEGVITRCYNFMQASHADAAKFKSDFAAKIVFSQSWLPWMKGFRPILNYTPTKKDGFCGIAFLAALRHILVKVKDYDKVKDHQARDLDYREVGKNLERALFNEFAQFLIHLWEFAKQPLGISFTEGSGFTWSRHPAVDD